MERINELKKELKDGDNQLKSGELNFEEYTWMELQMDEWRKELRALNKEMKLKKCDASEDSQRTKS